MRYLAQSQLLELQTKYEQVQELLAQAPSDPTIMPYRSKYLALEELSKMLELIATKDDGQHRHALTAYVKVNCGVIKAEVEEFAAAEKLLNESLQFCDKVEEERIVLACRLAAHNQLGILWSLRDDMAKSREHLEKSLSVYCNFGQERCREAIIWEQLVFPHPEIGHVYKDDATKQIELLITHTYYYLAQVHGKLGNSKKSAEYCHETLSRQLRTNTYDPIDWATNAAVLSQFYLNQDNFTSARYHLASAQFIFQKHFDIDGNRIVDHSDTEKDVVKEVTMEVEEADETREKEEEAAEKVAKCRGTTAKLSAKYGLSLMDCSRRNDKMDEIYKTIEAVESAEDEALENPEFDNLELGDKLKEVTAAKVSDWESARNLFLWAQKNIIAAQTYFTMNERDHSQLYKFLIHWEVDIDRQAKMYRRRADILEAVVDELSVTHYLLVVRQIRQCPYYKTLLMYMYRFELGEIFSDLMDLKRQKLTTEPSNPNVIKKVNMLVTQAIKHFTAFQDTMKVSGKLPEKYNEDTVRPALLTHFHLGRLSSKFVVPSGSEQELRNVVSTYSSYKSIVDYCEANPDGATAMEEELEVCKEMVRLMPTKIERMRRELVRS